MRKKKNDTKTFKNKFKQSDLSTRLSKYGYMNCYSYNKRNNRTEFDDLSSLFDIGYPFNKDKIQSIDFIYSGTTNGQYLITGIVGRMDENNMYDRDVFNIFPDNLSGDTYSIIQSFHFKDEHGQRLTDKYSSNTLTTYEDKVKELYQAVLTGRTTNFTFNDYSKDFEKFIRACHLTYKRLLK